jgi:ABC-type glutathione transport system ATPase component
VALKDATFSLPSGRVLGITGPSGSGKSTLARCIACLEPWDSGELRVAGSRVNMSNPSLVREARLQVQLVLQESAAALNPEFSIVEAVREPLDIQGKGDKRERSEAAMTTLERVGLSAIPASRNVKHLSTGQRQRIALARALTMQPSVLILDETLSDLDLGVRAEIVNLLLDIQSERVISYVFISHDLRLTCHIADEVLAIKAGQIFRRDRGEQVFRHEQECD